MHPSNGRSRVNPLTTMDIPRRNGGGRCPARSSLACTVRAIVRPRGHRNTGSDDTRDHNKRTQASQTGKLEQDPAQPSAGGHGPPFVSAIVFFSHSDPSLLFTNTYYMFAVPRSPFWKLRLY